MYNKRPGFGSEPCRGTSSASLAGGCRADVLPRCYGVYTRMGRPRDRQMGQRARLAAQRLHAHRWPQLGKTVSGECSRQTTHSPPASPPPASPLPWPTAEDAAAGEAAPAAPPGAHAAAPACPGAACLWRSAFSTRRRMLRRRSQVAACCVAAATSMVAPTAVNTVAHCWQAVDVACSEAISSGSGWRLNTNGPSRGGRSTSILPPRRTAPCGERSMGRAEGCRSHPLGAHKRARRVDSNVCTAGVHALAAEAGMRGHMAQRRARPHTREGCRRPVIDGRRTLKAEGCSTAALSSPTAVSMVPTGRQRSTWRTPSGRAPVTCSASTTVKWRWAAGMLRGRAGGGRGTSAGTGSSRSRALHTHAASSSHSHARRANPRPQAVRQVPLCACTDAWLRQLPCLHHPGKP